MTREEFWAQTSEGDWRIIYFHGEVPETGIIMAYPDKLWDSDGFYLAESGTTLPLFYRTVKAMV